MPSLRKINRKKLKKTVKLVNAVINSVITNSITEINNLLFAGMSMVAENIEKMKKNKTNETEKNLCGRGEFRQILQGGEKMSVD